MTGICGTGRRRQAALLVAMVGLGACSGGGTTPTPTTTAAIANPASVFCESVGGRVEIKDEPAGQVGICALPDGRRIDEWELYRSRGSTTTAAVANRCSASDLPADLPAESGLPAPVTAMRDDLAAAAVACGYDRLAELAHRNGRSVRFSYGAETDPAAFWRQVEASGAQPAPLRALRLLLTLPFARTDAAGSTTYTWPAAHATDHPTDAQLREIADTGLYDLATLQGWVASGTNYLGYRILITERGDWQAFVTGD